MYKFVLCWTGHRRVSPLRDSIQQPLTYSHHNELADHYEITISEIAMEICRRRLFLLSSITDHLGSRTVFGITHLFVYSLLCVILFWLVTTCVCTLSISSKNAYQGTTVCREW